MSVPVKLDPDSVLFISVKENCCLCRAPTAYWFVPKDVALCLACAETTTPEEIPSKKEWIEKERALRPSWMRS